MRLSLCLCLLAACSRDGRARPLRPTRPVAVAPTPPPALPAPDPVATWQAATFGHADIVIAVELGKPDADGLIEGRVLADWRGYQLARVVPLDGLQGVADARPGSRWLVAATQHQGASPAAYVLARVPDSDAERARITALVTPPWRETPVVALVTIAEVRPSTAAAEGHAVFDVERVLRGPLATTRLDDFVMPWPQRHPLVAGPQKYVLSAWQVSTLGGLPDPFVVTAGLTPVAGPELGAIERALAGDPRAALERRFTDASTQLADATIDFHFHEAPLVVDSVVTETEEEATNCGGLHFILSATRALRGPAPICKVDSFGMGGRPRLSPGGTGAPAFVGGGHCYYGPERMGQRWLAGGFAACGDPNVRLPWSPAAEARVRAAMAAPPARFAARPVEPAVFGPHPPAPPANLPLAHPFEPALPIEAIPLLSWIRFEVVRRRDVPLPDGRTYSWIECRAIEQGRFGGPTPAERWMFAGAGLPAWPVGSRWWGGSTPLGRDLARDRQTPKLFLPALFLPGEPADAQDFLVRLLSHLHTPG